MANPFGNLGNLGQLMKQAQKMAEDAQRVEQQLEAERVEATSGGGMVKAVVTGKGQMMDITIDPQVVDPDDVEMLQDLVVTAVREALEKAAELRASRLEPLMGGMGVNLGGLGIPGLK